MLAERRKTSGAVRCKTIRATRGIEPSTPIHERISAGHDMHILTLSSRNSTTSIIIPSTVFLYRVDPLRAMSLEKIREEIQLRGRNP